MKRFYFHSRAVIFFWLLLIFLLAACNRNAERATASPTPRIANTPSLQSRTVSASYRNEYPLALENQWVYEVSRYSEISTNVIITTSATLTDTIVGMDSTPSYLAVQFNREEKLLTSNKENKDVPSNTEAVSEYWLVFIGNKVYRQEGHFNIETMREALIQFTFPLEIGTSWYLSDEQERASPISDKKLLPQRVDEDAQIVTQAGKFENCKIVKSEWVDATIKTWICPDVGIVNQFAEHKGRVEGFHQVLLRYTIH